MTRRIFFFWLLALGLSLVVALALFTGEITSEVAGSLAFVLFVLCFPASLLAFPLALIAILPFEGQGLFPYNSRLLLCLWWAIFFASGLTQWRLVFWIVNRRSAQQAARRNAPYTERG